MSLNKYAVFKDDGCIYSSPEVGNKHILWDPNESSCIIFLLFSQTLIDLYTKSNDICHNCFYVIQCSEPTVHKLTI